ncbi:ABC transporter ATP-binding protein [Flagellimonas flava]|uniref:Molybdate transport system ATP-binding protein n=1 Tax=Flagellimonas flava TaxID=570519 RepID=A0A1M5IDQ7_9FLAO|nr:ATP-binding cassette domain-containing protein [Allomuricauda flava]SHG25923.1 molybdate transport system ATP-binding protein [Allomuricauda flava]
MIEIKLQKALNGPEGPMMLSLDIAIDKGKLVTLYGPSGAGKTSTLRILSGLLKPDNGYIAVDGRIWLDTAKGIDLKPQERGIGYVFQDYALFPHLTIRQNLEFGLKKSQPREVVSELIHIMELENIQDRKPNTLSGGQQQRVALARALVQRPKLLLLDEPLSALDFGIRLKLQNYLQEVHKTYGLTTVLISHDIGEILKLSDWTFKLHHGKVIQQGNPTDVFTQSSLSGKFKFKGEVIQIQQEDVVFVVSVLIQNELVKIVAQESEVKELSIGDTVIVASKAFNPIIYKIK